MEYMKVNEIREKYLSFFVSKGHLRIPSASVVPKDDPSILLINAGMTPMKKYFTGALTPPSKRITNSQKCIRTGDIDNIGLTARHVTFFEMLGNFSFGDYFKHEMIPWIWEFCTDILKLDPKKLYPTVYELDNEAYDIWTKVVGVPSDHVYKFGKSDNFWEHGVGPSGPCTEILYDRGPEKGCGQIDCRPGHDCDRYMEFWNSVFSQFERQEDGSYKELAQKNIDTGVGLERLATIIQDVDSIFEIDTIKSILNKVCAISNKQYGKNYNDDVSLRIITDHVRTAVVMISDGITPSNNGRGYVLRRLLRRAVRQGNLLGIEDQFLAKIADEVIIQSEDAFPELRDNYEFIIYTLDAEETSFNGTLNTGNKILAEYIEETKNSGSKILAGEYVFMLHDTYGFPVDLTREIALESGLDIDEDEFNSLMEEQKSRAQANTKKNVQSAWAGDGMPKEVAELDATNFVGYEKLQTTSEILYLLVEHNDRYEIVQELNVGDHGIMIVDQTPFYGTGGGQIGDFGIASQGQSKVKITMTNKNRSKVYFHSIQVLEGILRCNESIMLQVDESNRWATARNHTTTHLLHKALKSIIGQHVTQAGSEFNGEYFRFDFNHQGALTFEQLQAVEDEVNRAILADMKVEAIWEEVELAKEKGAIALFDQTYDDIMRTVYIGGDYSIELCGGTHLSHTSQAGSFRILNEYSVAAGVRRIEAVSGFNALNKNKDDKQLLSTLAYKLNANINELEDRIAKLLDKNKFLEKEIYQLEQERINSQNDDLTKKAKNIQSINLLVSEVETDNIQQMRELGDRFMLTLNPAVILLGRKSEGKVNFLVMCSDEAIAKKVYAGDIAKFAAQITGGGGGGKANMAQAGGKDESKLKEALEAASQKVESILISD